MQGLRKGTEKNMQWRYSAGEEREHGHDIKNATFSQRKKVNILIKHLVPTMASANLQGALKASQWG